MQYLPKYSITDSDLSEYVLTPLHWQCYSAVLNNRLADMFAVDVASQAYLMLILADLENHELIMADREGIFYDTWISENSISERSLAPQLIHPTSDLTIQPKITPIVHEITQRVDDEMLIKEVTDSDLHGREVIDL